MVSTPSVDCTGNEKQSVDNLPPIGEGRNCVLQSLPYNRRELNFRSFVTSFGSTLLAKLTRLIVRAKLRFLKYLSLIICYGCKTDSNVYSLALSQRDTTVILFTDELYETFKNGFTSCSDVELVDLFAFNIMLLNNSLFKTRNKFAN